MDTKWKQIARESAFYLAEMIKNPRKEMREWAKALNLVEEKQKTVEPKSRQIGFRI